MKDEWRVRLVDGRWHAYCGEMQIVRNFATEAGARHWMEKLIRNDWERV